MPTAPQRRPSNPLTEENQRLQTQLTALLAEANRNQQIMRRHQLLDLQLIGATGFRELLDCIFSTLKASSELDAVTLALIDPEHEIRRSLADLGIQCSEFPHLLFLQQASTLGPLAPLLTRPILGPYSSLTHAMLFPAPPAPASVAMLPLVRNRRLIGCLNFGSMQPARFSPQMATDFVEHLSSIIAICIENVLNQERIKQIGLTDPLTGIPNRRYVERRLLEEVGRMRRQQHPLSCLYIDIDHFKRINDRIGHQAGDAVLCEVAARIKAELRLSDALGRFGGEEFLVVLGNAERDHARVVAERIRASVANQPLMPGPGMPLKVTVSVGAATLLAPDRHIAADMLAQQLIAQADRALYQAKASGRNRVVSAG
jgi:two-component system cell cycle response regulator